jgi:hypothetical protein
MGRQRYEIEPMPPPGGRGDGPETFDRSEDDRRTTDLGFEFRALLFDRARDHHFRLLGVGEEDAVTMLSPHRRCDPVYDLGHHGWMADLARAGHSRRAPLGTIAPERRHQA